MHISKDDRVVVTGGSGFLGSHILRDLVEQGFTNIAVLKRESSRMDLVSDIAHKVSWVDGDILDIMSLETLIHNASAVIHSAAKVSYNPKDRDSIMSINVEGTANVVNVSLSAKVRRLIFISSVAALGRSLKGGEIDEHVEWYEDEMTTNYGRSKHLAEMEVWRGMHEGLDVGILNPSMILGPSYWGSSSTKLFTYVANGGRLYPSGSNAFVDVRDVAQLSTRFLLSEKKNERVIAVSEMYTYRDFLTLIARELEVAAPSIKLGSKFSGIVWRLLALTSDPAITKETVAITSNDFSYDNSRSRELFDFSYRSVNQSIQDTCAIYDKNLSAKQDFGFFKRIRS